MIARGRPAPANRPPSPPASLPCSGQAGEARQRTLQRPAEVLRGEVNAPAAQRPGGAMASVEAQRPSESVRRPHAQRAAGAPEHRVDPAGDAHAGRPGDVVDGEGGLADEPPRAAAQPARAACAEARVAELPGAL